jgi:ankyrin repeat protein
MLVRSAGSTTLRPCTVLALLLMDHGANPNEQNTECETPLHYTSPNAPRAAKFLLMYSDKTDPDILANDGQSSFLSMVRRNIAKGTSEAFPHNPHPETMLFQVEQWKEVENCWSNVGLYRVDDGTTIIESIV